MRFEIPDDVLLSLEEQKKYLRDLLLNELQEEMLYSRFSEEEPEEYSSERIKEIEYLLFLIREAKHSEDLLIVKERMFRYL